MHDDYVPASKYILIGIALIYVAFIVGFIASVA